MGGGFYSMDNRSTRAVSMDYSSASADLGKVFHQQRVGHIHESMQPKGALLREACDSAAHLFVVPIILGMDVTGSMGELPVFLVTEGLPNIMGKLIERGVDPALLFMAIGDHESDRSPIQIGQFEAGDAELDMWLTRSWIEKGGGGNGGESYLLAHYYAINHVKTDAWDKRGKKGFLFTIGDEPNLKHLPASAIKEIFGTHPERGYSSAELIQAAQEKFHVFHINIRHNWTGESAGASWREMLGEGLIEVTHADQVADVIVDKIAKIVDRESGYTPHTSVANPPKSTPSASGTSGTKPEEEML